VIARSDLIILVVSASALAIGVYRWQANTHTAPVIAQQAPAQTSTIAPGSASQVVGADGAALVAVPAAYETGTSVAAVSAANQEIVEIPANAVGEPVVIDPAQTAAQTAAVAQSGGSNSEPTYGTYQVRWGDYLGSIAIRFDTDVRTLRELNGISGSNIREGQQLRYPLPANSLPAN
jgi:LysM repeat protein